MTKYIADLIYAKNYEGLTHEQKNELHNFLVIEHLMILIKAVAHKHVVKE